MAPDSEISDAAVPSDAILEKTLRDIVRTAKVNPITIKTLRATAEERLGLDAGFSKNSAKWSTKSKDSIEDESKEPSQILSSPGSHLHTANQQPSTSTMASHAPSDIITTLPSEVLGIIVHHCDDGDLGNLRLSCKTLGTAATQPFGRRCLAERRFVFAEYSMQGLVDLTVHPVFSPCVRSLSFGICRLEMPKYGSASTDASRQKLSELVDKNNDFVHSGTHMLMLVQTLQNLKAHGNLQVSLGIFDDTNKDYYGEPFYKGYGYDAAYATFSPRSCEGRNALRYIRDNLSLNILEMKQVSIETETGTTEIPVLQETISWSGRDEIREGLDSIIAHLVAMIQSDADEEE
ncbi:hypothetical protein VTO58DRAFT_103603 [Aureobasidium pullulans]|nr:hypothetical protein JADG_006445 [Aureobasidium pullulans]